MVAKRKRSDEIAASTSHIAEQHAGPSLKPKKTRQKAPTRASRSKMKGKAQKMKASDDLEPQGEKRAAPFRKTCPWDLRDRVERVMTQRMFMIYRQRNEGECREEFSVLGSTGNVYTVTINKTSQCDCPDAQWGRICKHIFFKCHVNLLWYQKALLATELEQIFRDAPLAPNSMAHPHIREAHARATGKTSIDTNIKAGKKRIPGPDDDCPICYDSMHEFAEELLTFCQECGSALHNECFQQWKQAAEGRSEELTCVWCRASWGKPSIPKGVTWSHGGFGYLNLADVEEDDD